jgi:hypothetical protein
MKHCAVKYFSLLLLILACSESEIEKDPKTEDPLPSWVEGETKNTILDFLAEVTDPSSQHFVAEKDRIATFDNDGTLWAEQPVYFQFLYAVDQVKNMADQNQEMLKDTLFQTVSKGDLREIARLPMKDIGKVMAISHTGMNTEAFDGLVKDWMKNAKHPTTGKPFSEMVYQPMRELIACFQNHGFKTYIVSGGGMDFMRAWAPDVYGIPTEQIIGSQVKVAYKVTDTGPEIQKLPEIDFTDDNEGKPIGIHRFIGKKPIAAFGNSDGDLQMLEWTMSGPGKRLAAIVHHTDSDREWAYDRDSHIGKLDKALDRAKADNWLLIDMKNDWSKVFP